ncbi:MAG: acetate kinase [Firmicutes bacterium]|nr:acetate kinase [Bacillota bacterium]
MKVLVINAGSSSLKYQLIDMDNEGVLAKGLIERIGLDKAIIGQTILGKKSKVEERLADHSAALKVVLDALVGQDAPLKSIEEIDAVGHRVVHSGEKFCTSVKLDDGTIADIEKISDLAPLHNPANLMGIKACLNILPSKPAVAVFDTSFHSTMPDHAFMYALPYDLYKDHQIRKYGFHGTSHLFVSSEANKALGGKKSKVIVCHLGNGASLSAVVDGKCVDTTMGLTPLEGLMMGTRSGDIDPSVVEFVMQKTGQTIGETTNMLNKKSGVFGVSGVSSDFRDVLQAEKDGNKQASLAIEMFVYRVKKYIGSYMAAMNGLDAIAFTAGVGENSPILRERLCKELDGIGILLDDKKNQATVGEFGQISSKKSKVKVFVIPTNEELVIARETIKYGFSK